MNLAKGQVFGGDFVLIRPLGEGGMGLVWLAEECPLGRQVALKIMRPAESPTRASRFEREARALAALNHPSVLSVLCSPASTQRPAFTTSPRRPFS